jgi:dUTP pyrophosphatase
MQPSQGVLQIVPYSAEIAEWYQQTRISHEGDSGYDLYMATEVTIKAGESKIIELGINATAYDAQGKNISWIILPRSSIMKTPLRMSNSIGLIDAGYRGQILVGLDNIKNYDYTIKRKDKLIQVIFPNLEPFKIELKEDLTTTSRGSGGIGSTGR